jgi:hypothetical protein
MGKTVNQDQTTIGVPPVVFLEGLASCLFLEDPIDVDLYQQALRNQLNIALDEGHSRALIAAVANSLDTEASTDAPISRSNLTWRRSSYTTEQISCVEVASATDAVAVRDSKDPDCPVLLVPRTAFVRFVRSLR